METMMILIMVVIPCLQLMGELDRHSDLKNTQVKTEDMGLLPCVMLTTADPTAPND